MSENTPEARHAMEKGDVFSFLDELCSVFQSSGKMSDGETGKSSAE